MSERLNLEQLKAMSESELVKLWSNGRVDRFPFDLSDCGNCLTLHSLDVGCHQEIANALAAMEPGPWYSDVLGYRLKKHIEELYALRLFFDHLYPQPTAAESQLPSASGAQPDLGVETVELPTKSSSLDRMVEDWYDASANTR